MVWENLHDYDLNLNRKVFKTRTLTWRQAPKMLVNFASFRSVFDSTMEALEFSEVLKTQANCSI